MKNSPFDCELIKIDNNCSLFIVAIGKITKELKEDIDSKLVSICVPDANFGLETVKKVLLDFLISKNTKQGKASNMTMGIIAEFFNHLILKNYGFEQEFQFFNLEEGSMKKGFDGVYSYQNDYWLMESKSSGMSNSTHKTNIKTAHTNLKGKISGKAKNNPWFNAFNHIKVINSSSLTLVKK